MALIGSKRSQDENSNGFATYFELAPERHISEELSNVILLGWNNPEKDFCIYRHSFEFPCKKVIAVKDPKTGKNRDVLKFPDSINPYKSTNITEKIKLNKSFDEIAEDEIIKIDPSFSKFIKLEGIK